MISTLIYVVFICIRARVCVVVVVVVWANIFCLCVCLYRCFVASMAPQGAIDVFENLSLRPPVNVVGILPCFRSLQLFQNVNHDFNRGYVDRGGGGRRVCYRPGAGTHSAVQLCSSLATCSRGANSFVGRQSDYCPARTTARSAMHFCLSCVCAYHLVCRSVVASVTIPRRRFCHVGAAGGRGGGVRL